MLVQNTEIVRAEEIIANIMHDENITCPSKFVF